VSPLPAAPPGPVVPGTPVPSRESGVPRRLHPTTPVRVGVTLPQFTGDSGRFVAAARRAAAVGLDSVWVFDHLWPLTGGRQRPVLEGWTALAWLAAATQHIGLGTLVTRSTLRHPALLAKMAATVATVAPGRVTVGVGSGDERSRAENEAFGLPYVEGGGRLAQLEDTIAVLRQHGRGTVAYSGPHARVVGLPASPRPCPPPALWVAGRSPGIIRMAGRLADGWNSWGATPQAFADGVARLEAAAGPRSVEPTWGGLVLLAATDSEARAAAAARPSSTEGLLVGGPETVAGRLSELVAAGARHVVLTLPNASEPGLFELVGERVKPALAAP
jgi:alkanesulfonate monooxygenase SsuD/methylene tetrahydromethanopterin reductase-like flavin-dependent oxidoreductase (luciferase family)